MSETLSNGFKKPETGDRNFWGDLEDDIDQLNSHTHDGIDSEQLSPKNLSKSTANIASGSWAAVAGHAGTYKQTITVPTGYAVDSMQVKFYITAGGQAGYEVYPSIRKASSTTYEVFTNDNSVGYTAVYG
jgi:hypothetical protein